MRNLKAFRKYLENMIERMKKQINGIEAKIYNSASRSPEWRRIKEGEKRDAQLFIKYLKWTIKKIDEWTPIDEWKKSL